MMLFHPLWYTMRSSHFNLARQGPEADQQIWHAPIPTPLPEGWRLSTDHASPSSLQAVCICETGLFLEHWSEL